MIEAQFELFQTGREKEMRGKKREESERESLTDGKRSRSREISFPTHHLD